MAKAATVAKKGNLENVPLIAVPAGTEMDIPMDLIIADPKFNARKDLEGESDEGHSLTTLMESLKKDGQLSPVLVATVKEHPGKYLLVFGFRRLMALAKLGKSTIRASIYQPKDAKGKDKEISEADLLYVNLIENEARKSLNPFERATRYHELVKTHKESGNAVAKRVSLDPSYVNRLVASMEMHPKLIERFREEHAPSFKGTRLLTTDNINKLTKMKKDGGEKQDHESQLAWLDKQLNPAPAVDPDAEGGEGDGEGDSGPDIAPRATLAQIKRALIAAKAARKETKNTKELERMDGIIEGLEFCIKPKNLAGILKLKEDGKVILGHDGKQVALPRSA